MVEKVKTATSSTPDNFKHLVRIANVDLPGEKQLRWALTNIKGIAINLSDAICLVTNIKRETKAGYLSESDVQKLNDAVNNPSKYGIPVWMFNRRKDFETGQNLHLLTGTLNFYHENDLKRLKKTKTLRGIRHIAGQPVRGQRTRSHFRKNKGKVVGVTKKAEAQKKAAEGSEKKDDKGKKEKK